MDGCVGGGSSAAASWQAVVSVPGKGLLRPAAIAEEALLLDAPTEGQNIVSDYASTGLTLGRHPLALLRTRLNRMRLMPAAVLNTYEDGKFARCCGIVTVRQRPSTSKGVIFATLEDETGTVNIIVWPSLAEKQRKELLGASLLGVYGRWQSHSNVRNMVAMHLVDLSAMLGQLSTRSRDFS